MTESPAFDSERAILAGCIIDSKIVPDSLSPEDFGDLRHRTIYEAIIALHEKGEAIDLVTVRKALGPSIERAGGVSYLAGLVEGVPKLDGLSAWVKIVKEAAAIRHVSDDLSRVQRMLSEGASPSAVLNVLEHAASGMRDRMHVGSGPKKLEEYLKPLLNQIEDEAEGRLKGIVMTGFRDLDTMVGGFRPNDLVVLAAGTGVGKSSFAANVAKNCKTETLIVSLEMSGASIAKRLLFGDAQINHQRVRHGLEDHEWEKLGTSFGNLTPAPIWIDDTARTPGTIRSRALKLRDKFGLGFIVVDYIQLLSGDKKSDTLAQEVGQISGALKLLAMEMEIPILALSQFSRAAAQSGRKDKRPILSDLRDSGKIENDADKVIFLYRENGSVTSRTEVIVAKNRDGQDGVILLDFDKSTTTFMDIKETE